MAAPCRPTERKKAGWPKTRRARSTMAAGSLRGHRLTTQRTTLVMIRARMLGISVCILIFSVSQCLRGGCFDFRALLLDSLGRQFLQELLVILHGLELRCTG